MLGDGVIGGGAEGSSIRHTVISTGGIDFVEDTPIHVSRRVADGDRSVRGGDESPSPSPSPSLVSRGPISLSSHQQHIQLIQQSHVSSGSSHDTRVTEIHESKNRSVSQVEHLPTAPVGGVVPSAHDLPLSRLYEPTDISTLTRAHSSLDVHRQPLPPPRPPTHDSISNKRVPFSTRTSQPIPGRVSSATSSNHARQPPSSLTVAQSILERNQSEAPETKSTSHPDSLVAVTQSSTRPTSFHGEQNSLATPIKQPNVSISQVSLPGAVVDNNTPPKILPIGVTTSASLILTPTGSFSKPSPTMTLSNLHQPSHIGLNENSPAQPLFNQQAEPTPSPIESMSDPEQSPLPSSSSNHSSQGILPFDLQSDLADSGHYGPSQTEPLPIGKIETSKDPSTAKLTLMQRCRNWYFNRLKFISQHIIFSIITNLLLIIAGVLVYLTFSRTIHDLNRQRSSGHASWIAQELSSSADGMRMIAEHLATSQKLTSFILDSGSSNSTRPYFTALTQSLTLQATASSLDYLMVLNTTQHIILTTSTDSTRLGTMILDENLRQVLNDYQASIQSYPSGLVRTVLISNTEYESQKSTAADYDPSVPIGQDVLLSLVVVPIFSVVETLIGFVVAGEILMGAKMRARLSSFDSSTNPSYGAVYFTGSNQWILSAATDSSLDEATYTLLLPPFSNRMDLSTRTLPSEIELDDRTYIMTSQQIPDYTTPCCSSLYTSLSTLDTATTVSTVLIHGSSSDVGRQLRDFSLIIVTYTLGYFGVHLLLIGLMWWFYWRPVQQLLDHTEEMRHEAKQTYEIEMQLVGGSSLNQIPPARSKENAVDIKSLPPTYPSPQRPLSYQPDPNIPSDKSIHTVAVTASEEEKKQSSDVPMSESLSDTPHFSHQSLLTLRLSYRGIFTCLVMAIPFVLLLILLLESEQMVESSYQQEVLKFTTIGPRVELAQARLLESKLLAISLGVDDNVIQGNGINRMSGMIRTYLEASYTHAPMNATLKAILQASLQQNISVPFQQQWCFLINNQTRTLVNSFMDQSDSLLDVYAYLNPDNFVSQVLSSGNSTRFTSVMSRNGLDALRADTFNDNIWTGVDALTPNPPSELSTKILASFLVVPIWSEITLQQASTTSTGSLTFKQPPIGVLLVGQTLSEKLSLNQQIISDMNLMTSTITGALSPITSSVIAYTALYLLDPNRSNSYQLMSSLQLSPIDSSGILQNSCLVCSPDELSAMFQPFVTDYLNQPTSDVIGFVDDVNGLHLSIASILPPSSREFGSLSSQPLSQGLIGLRVIGLSTSYYSSYGDASKQLLIGFTVTYLLIYSCRTSCAYQSYRHASLRLRVYLSTFSPMQLELFDQAHPTTDSNCLINIGCDSCWDDMEVMEVDGEMFLVTRSHKSKLKTQQGTSKAHKNKTMRHSDQPNQPPIRPIRVWQLKDGEIPMTPPPMRILHPQPIRPRANSFSSSPEDQKMKSERHQLRRSFSQTDFRNLMDKAKQRLMTIALGEGYHSSSSGTAAATRRHNLSQRQSVAGGSEIRDSMLRKDAAISGVFVMPPETPLASPTPSILPNSADNSHTLQKETINDGHSPQPNSKENKQSKESDSNTPPKDDNTPPKKDDHYNGASHRTNRRHLKTPEDPFRHNHTPHHQPIKIRTLSKPTNSHNGSVNSSTFSSPHGLPPLVPHKNTELATGYLTLAPIPRKPSPTPFSPQLLADVTAATSTLQLQDTHSGSISGHSGLVGRGHLVIPSSLDDHRNSTPTPPIEEDSSTSGRDQPIPLILTDSSSSNTATRTLDSNSIPTSAAHQFSHVSLDYETRQTSSSNSMPIGIGGSALHSPARPIAPQANTNTPPSIDLPPQEHIVIAPVPIAPPSSSPANHCCRQ